MNGDDIVCRWSLPISFVYTHAHYISTPIVADRYCTHIMVACHAVYHARNDTLSHAGEDTKEHYRSGKRPHAMRSLSCAFLKFKPATVLPHCPHLQCTLSPAHTWPTLILAWDPQEASSRNSFSGTSQGAWCERMVHGGVQGVWGSVVCMGEYRMHGRVQGARCECRVHGRVKGAWGSVGCIGEYRVHWRVQGAKCKYRVHGRVQRVWESVGCIGECQVAEP